MCNETDNAERDKRQLRQTGQMQRHKKTAFRMVLTALLAAAAVLVVSRCCFYKNGSVDFTISPKRSVSPAGGIKLTDSAADTADGVAIPGFDSLSFPADRSEVSVDLFNPAENEGLYYLTFELRLEDDNGGYESLYTSGLVEPGERISAMTLSRPLERGEYNAVIRVQPYRMSSGMSVTNNADIKIKLSVK